MGLSLLTKPFLPGTGTGQKKVLNFSLVLLLVLRKIAYNWAVVCIVMHAGNKLTFASSILAFPNFFSSYLILCILYKHSSVLSPRF